MDELQSLFDKNPSAFSSDMNYVQGTLISWDAVSGANKVLLPGGTQLTNVKILNTNVFTYFNLGDSLALLLINNQYTIMGKVKSAGNGIESVQSGRVLTNQGTSSLTYTDLATVGPLITCYVGPSRTALVFVSALIFATSQQAQATFEVSGASTIGAALMPGAIYGPASNATAQSGVVSSNQILLTAADGLNQGMNTFKMKYISIAGQAVSFASRVITVIPF